MLIFQSFHQHNCRYQTFRHFTLTNRYLLQYLWVAGPLQLPNLTVYLSQSIKTRQVLEIL